MATNRIIQHAHFKYAFDLASQFVERKFKSINIMIIMGPSGVGKTTLRHELMRKYYRDQSKWSVGKLRVIESMAMQSSNAYYTSRSLAISLHRELMAPDQRFLSTNIEGDQFNNHCKIQMQSLNRIGIDINYNRTTETDIWLRATDLAKEREVEMICIEHADALSKNHANEKPAEHMRQLMSINETIGSRLILTTATNGYKLWERDREIRDRLLIVPLLPYDLRDNEEYISFVKLLKAIQSDYDFEPNNLLGIMTHEIAAVTGTAIRDIVSLFDKAKMIASFAKRTKIQKSDLMAALPSFADCEDIHTDINLFRSKVQPCSARELKLLLDKHVRIK